MKKKLIIIFILLVLFMSVIKMKKDSKVLDGVTIVLDAGHGGFDGGSEEQGIKEAKINLEIVEKLKEECIKQGAKIILTRDGDYDLASINASNRKKEDLKKRIDIINQDQVDLFISIHLNSYSSPSLRGGQVFYQANNEASKLLAQKMQERIQKVTNSSYIEKVGDYYILNESNKIGLLIECGFISNPEERILLQDDKYQEKLANEIFQGIKDYFYMLQ